MSFKSLTTVLVLVSVLMQGAFFGLQNSMVICLGGGHDHAAQSIAATCETCCTHSTEWAVQIAENDHDDTCSCTDIEPALIELLSTQRYCDNDLNLVAASPIAVLHIAMTPPYVSTWRGTPPKRADDPGGDLRLAIVRSTRLNI